MARMGEGRGVHRVLVGKPEGKKTTGDTQCLLILDEIEDGDS